MYKIITIDGGGVKGIMPITILRRIEEQVPGLIRDADLLAGTSIGGILALCLANEYPTSFVEEYFKEQIPNIFKKRWFGAGLVDSKYDNTKLHKCLLQLFDEKTLELIKKKVLVPTFELKDKDGKGWEPKFYNNFSGSEDLKETLLDIGMSTSAAPTYFPVYKGHIDGGVCANNPTMAAWAQATKQFKSDNLEVPKKDFIILSLGCGNSNNHLHAMNNKWGSLTWISSIIPILMEGPNDVINHECELLLGENYFRVNPRLHKHIPLDGADSIDRIYNAAKEYDISEVVEWLKEKWK